MYRRKHFYLIRFVAGLLVVVVGQVTAQCSYPGSPAHASLALTNEKMSTGTVATYTCDNGYELLGPSRRVCNQNGTWTPVGIPFCVLNVAVGKAAMQSSVVGQGSAQKAVDGSPSSIFNPSTCTMTEAERRPWFYVNLLEPVLVQLVRIDFGSSCCNGRTATLTVQVGNNRPDLGTNPVCRKYTGHIEEGRPLYLPCTRPMAGAFVSVTLESVAGNSNPLSICELFVYTDHALSIEQCPTFRDQPLGATSTYDGKCYIFYNEHPLTFENAKKFCEMRGGSLVDETSPALQGFLSWELYRRHRNDQNGQYWLGAVRDQRNNWKWINGKEVSISFWNQPGSGTHNCSRFDGTKGWLWSDTPCSVKLNYMCQHRPLSCGRPERPPNSTILVRSVDVGQSIEYRCNEGNLLIGPSIRTCLSHGFFSEYAPKCKHIECGHPQAITNGHYLLNNRSRSYLSTLTYHCKEGFVLVGRANLACDADGLWNGPPPRCEPVLCPNPPNIANGYSLFNSTRFDSFAEYKCDSGYQLIGAQMLQCNKAGYWQGQPGYCLEVRPISVTSSFGTTSSTSTTSSTTSTTVAPTTSFASMTVIKDGTTVNFDEDKLQPEGITRKPPQIALLPVMTQTSNVFFNPYTKVVDQTTSLPSWTETVPPRMHNIASSPSPPIILSSPIAPVPVGQRPRSSLVESKDKLGNGFLSKPSKMAAARLNMGGIIALGIFGGFVFLAAVITIIIIIFRRIKHSHSSLDAQTISTFDSTNGDNPGFYHKYASAWSQLQNSAAVLHSATSYKPNNIPYSMAATAHHADHHHFHERRPQRSSPNSTGQINEGFRDSTPPEVIGGEVYSRSADRRNNNHSSSPKRSDREWHHLTRAVKY